MWLQRLADGVLSGAATTWEDPPGQPVPQDKISSLRAALWNALEPFPVGTIVGICLPRDYRYLVTELVCIELGITFVPMSQRWPAARVGQVAAITGAKLIVDDAVLAALSSAEAAARPKQPREIPLDTLMYVLFTSGSTGEPKGVSIARRSFDAYVRSLDAATRHCTEAPRLLSVLDYSFDGAMCDIGILLLRAGCTFAISSSAKNVLLLAAEIARFKPTYLKLVPGSWMLLLQPAVHARAPLDSVRCAITGGARVSATLYERLAATVAKHARLFNSYGPTECTVATHLHEFTFDREVEVRDGVVTVGAPSKALRCAIVDDAGVVSTPGGEGELLVSGDQVMQGYFARPELTAAAFVELGGRQYYRTGDIVFADASGRHFVRGRVDDTFKRRGFRVNLSDVESYVGKLHEVAACACVALPDELTESQLLCFVIPSASAVTREDLITAMRAVLIEAQLPDAVIVCSELPVLATSGKVDKAELIRRYKTA